MDPLTDPRENRVEATERGGRPFVTVLGIAQDGGFPHIGCSRSCCRDAWTNPSLQRRVTALGLTDPASGRCWLFDATPDIRWQLRDLLHTTHGAEPPEGAPRRLAGVFLTHAHLGHYLGLALLGREALAGDHIPVYAMPRLRHFLESNGPWSLLQNLGHVDLQPLSHEQTVVLSPGLTVRPFEVPHRGELSETVGFRIAGPRDSVLFLPDIDRWEAWPESLPDWVRGVGAAYLDATFYDMSELPGRVRTEIPHPPVVDTMERLSVLSPADRGHVRFLHLNHSNPLLRDDSP
ncbi:MAG: pyrroloquinoline quinone biosynthesis protein PqqB, partial [Candidatus Eisenbacteria bacterium]|nr:pyrroloquinoline quinone biosynthesis protein PqqB [Candidatus Eisenbacteria bacterium]